MTEFNRFSRGKGCFKCIDCGKMTRETDINQGLEMCPHCTRIAEMENTISDNSVKSEDYFDNEEDKKLYREVMNGGDAQ